MDIKYVDIHAHVNFPDYGLDREVVFSRALENGVAMINVGTDKKTSEESVRMADVNKKRWAIVGLHPINVFNEQEFDCEFYKKLALNSCVVGIGECGLDYADRRGIDAEKIRKQKEAFIKQVELAIELDKPLMLHLRSGKERNAYTDALDILNSYKNPKLRGNAHFFAGTVEEAKQFIDLGFYISFTGVITFAEDSYRETVKYVPIDRILSETDSPYVSPIPHRGQRNEPSYVIEVVKKIAEIKGLPIETVRKAILENAKRLFVLEV